MKNVKKKHPKNYIKEIRKERGLTVTQLGKLVDVTGPAITMLENSNRGLTVPMLKKLADALGCHPSDITDGPAGAAAAEVMKEIKGLRDTEQRIYFEMSKNLLETIKSMRKNSE